MKKIRKNLESLDKHTLSRIKGGAPRIEYYYENGVLKWRIVE